MYDNDNLCQIMAFFRQKHLIKSWLSKNNTVIYLNDFCELPGNMILLNFIPPMTSQKGTDVGSV